jgi:hypothetical protein
MNPIECMWAIIQNKLHEKTYSNLDEMKEAFVKLWNRIPISLCQRLCNSFDKKVKQIQVSGNIFKKIKNEVNKQKTNKFLKWKRQWNSVDSIERIVYNDKTLRDTKKKA